MTTSTTTRRRSAAGVEAGFTLLEVIVAMALVGVVATAALAFFTRGYSASAQVQRTQTATTLANQAMEQARAVGARYTTVTAGGTTTDISGLVVGRQQSAVTAQWAASSNSGIADTWPASDPTATASSVPAIPLAAAPAPRVNGQTYQVRTLIGTCYRPRSDVGASAPAACTRQGSTAPTSDAYVATARIMVEVLWTPAGATSCPAGTCTYRTTGLIDPHGDLTWNNDPRIVAVADSASVVAGGSVDIDVLANDTGTDSSFAPVISTGPSTGTATVVNRKIRFVPGSPATLPLTTTLTYYVTSPSGAASGTATVTITITKPTPVAVADSAAATTGSPATITVLANDTADLTGVSSPVTVVAQPASGFGTASAATNGVVTYTPGTQPTSGTATATFTYRITDRYGTASNTATVTVTVTARPVAVDDAASTTRPSTGSSSTTIAVMGNDTGTFGTNQSPVTILSQPASGLGTASAAANGVVTFTTGTAPASGSATATFTYRLTDSGGTTSNTATVTVTVYAPPTANPFTTTLSAQRTAAAVTVPVMANATTSDPGAVAKILSLPSSGTLAVGGTAAAVGSTGTAVTYTPAASTIGTYTFTYAVVSNGVQSAAATVTLRVVPVVADYSATARRNAGTQRLTLGTNDTPANWSGLQLTASSGSTSCSTVLNGSPSVSSTSPPVLTWTPASPGTCTYSYTLSGNTAATSSLSDSGTITLSVTN